MLWYGKSNPANSQNASRDCQYEGLFKVIKQFALNVSLFLFLFFFGGWGKGVDMKNISECHLLKFFMPHRLGLLYSLAYAKHAG